jgi:hypothetical protein
LKFNLLFDGIYLLYLHGVRISEAKNQKEAGNKQRDMLLRNVG